MRTGFPMLAAVDGLITLIFIVALSAISSWLQKKRGQTDELSPPPEPGVPPPIAPRSRPTPPQASPPVAQGWEESLRRILQEAAPQKPPAQTAPAPRAPQPMPVGPRTRLPAATRASVPRPQARPPLPAQKEGPAKQPAKLRAVDDTYDRARNLKEKIAARFRSIDPAPLKVSTPRKGERNRTSSIEIAQAVALLRDKRRARQGIIAGLVLGPPKALET